MDRAEIYDYATSKGWRIISDQTSVCVYRFVETVGGDTPRYRYLFVSFNASDEYDGDETRLVLPWRGDIFQTDDDQQAALLYWWLDGNTGDENDWWNQLAKKDQEVL